jgi:hypothetical protein
VALAKSISNWHLIGHSSNTGYCSLTMFLWYPVMDLARAPRRALSNARKKGSGYENEAKLEGQSQSFHASRFGFMKKMGSLS